MKSSRTNSFRLHRTSRGSSLKKASQTFYHPDQSFKLASINSVSRGIKYNDLSFLTGEDLNKLRVEPLEANEGFYHSAHQNLTEVRKKYDHIKKTTTTLETRINNLKEELNKFQIFNNEFDGKKQNGKSKVQELQQNLEEKGGLLENTVMEKKVLLNLENRHKAEKIFYDQRKFDLNQELAFLKKQAIILRKDGTQIGESEDRTLRVYEKLNKQIQTESHQRNLHINSLRAMILEKEQCIENNHARQDEINEIAVQAMQGKDFNQKEWRKIYLTHTFVNKMLRNKIEKEMHKFKTVEFAFKEIKTATGVNDAKTMISKYLNKEIVYGELLSKIAENQKTIDQLKSSTQALTKEQKELEMELEVIQSIKLKSQDLHDDLKTFKQIDEKHQKADFYERKILSWLAKQHKKLNVFLGKHESHESLDGKEKMKDSLIKYLKIISSELEQPQKDVKYEKSEGNWNQKDNERIVRILPKKSRKNSIGEDIFDVEEEETNLSANFEEHEVINSQREELLKNNEKFMREVKRKREEERKHLIDKAEVKKDKVRQPEPKKQQQD